MAAEARPLLLELLVKEGSTAAGFSHSGPALSAGDGKIPPKSKAELQTSLTPSPPSVPATKNGGKPRIARCPPSQTPKGIIPTSFLCFDLSSGKDALNTSSQSGPH